MNHDVFISYSSKDMEAAKAICHVLEQNEIRCWMAPRDIPYGSQYGDVIDDAIKTCKVVVVLFSKTAVSSPWVNGELNVAFEEQKIIIPFRLDQTPLSGQTRVMLNQRHWIDAYPDYKTKFNDLVLAVAQSAGKVCASDATSSMKKNDTNSDSEISVLNIKSDLDAIVYIDDGQAISISKGNSCQTSIKKGTHKIKCVSKDNPDIFVEENAFIITNDMEIFSAKLDEINVMYNNAVMLTNQAREVYESGRWELSNRNNAYQMIEEALCNYPRYVPALFLKAELAEHSFGQNNEESEESIINRILQLEPYNTLALLKMGVFYFDRQEMEIAISYFQTVVDMENVDVEYKAFALNDIGACYMREGNYSKAEPFLSQASSLTNNNGIMCNEGCCLYQLKRYAESKQWFEKVVGNNNNSHESYYFIALCCINLGFYPQAISNIKKSFEIDWPFRDESMNISKYITEQMSDRIFVLSTKNSMVCHFYHNEGYLRDSKFAISLFACVAQALELMEEDNAALDCYQHILSYDRMNGFALEGIKNLDKKNGDKIGPITEKMLEVYNKAKKMLEDNKSQESLDVLLDAEVKFGGSLHYLLLLLIGEVYDRIGEKEKAIQYYNKSLSIYRHQPSLLLRLAYCYSEEEKYEQSLRLYQEIIEDGTSSKDDRLFAQNNMGVLYCQMNDYENAIQSYDNVLKVGYSGRIYFNKAYALLKTEKYAESLELFNRAIEEDDDLQNIAHLFVACCYVGIGTKNEAMNILARPLSEQTERSVEEIVAELYGSRYYYYGIPVSCVSRFVYKFENHLKFILNLCLCIGSTFENLGNKEKAIETYELMLKLDPENKFAKLAKRRLNSAFWLDKNESDNH